MPLWIVNTCDINDDDEDKDNDSDDDDDHHHHDLQLLIVLAPPPSALPHQAVQETGAETKHFSYPPRKGPKYNNGEAYTWKLNYIWRPVNREGHKIREKQTSDCK